MDTLIRSLKDKNVYVLFAHGSTVYDPSEKTYKRTIVPSSKLVVNFTLPGEYLMMTPHLSYYFTKIYHARNKSLLPLLAVYDSTDLYGKATNVYWYINDLHETTSASNNYINFEEQSPHNILKGRQFKPFTGAQSQFEHFYRSKEGSIIPDMYFSTNDPPVYQRFPGLFRYTDKKIEKISIPEQVYLHDILEILDENSVLYIVSCSSWKFKSDLQYNSGIRITMNMTPAAENINDDVRKALREADSQIQENELEYKSQELLSSSSPKGWALFNSLFPTVYMPTLTLLIDPSRNYENSTSMVEESRSNKRFNTFATKYDPISIKNFMNANLGLITRKYNSRKARKTRRRRSYRK